MRADCPETREIHSLPIQTVTQLTASPIVGDMEAGDEALTGGDHVRQFKDSTAYRFY